MPQRLDPGRTDTVQEWSRGPALALLLVVGVGLALGWASRSAALTVYGDDATYLTLSRSLAAGSYRDEFLFGAPLHAQYPPGMPAWLLVVQVVAGNSLDAALGANLLLVAMTAILLADAVRRLSSPWLGVTAAAVTMLNPALLDLASQLRSEIPFLAWCAVALWFSLVGAQRNRTWYAAATIVAALAAFFTRSVGIALIPAVCWALLLRRQWRALIVGGTTATMLVGAWFAYTRWAALRTVGHSYAVDFAIGPPVSAPTRVFTHAWDNFTIYFSQFAAVQFNIPDIHNQPLDNGIWGLCLLVPAVAGMRLLARRWPAVPVFLLLSAGILLLFPWPVGRFLTVHFPWLIALILIGAAGLATAAGSRHGERIAIALGLVLAGFGLAGRLQAAQREQRCRASAPFVDRHCYKPQDSSYVAAAMFIRDSLPEDAVVAASKPSIIYVLTQRRTLPLEAFARTSLARLLAPDGPATAILLSRLIRNEVEVVGPRLLARCSSLTLLAKFPLGTLLLGARTSADGSASDACLALTEFVRDAPPDPDAAPE